MRWLSTMLYIGITPYALAAQPIAFNTYEEAPYQVLVGSKLQGSATELLECAFAQLPNYQPEYRVHPLQRGLYNLKKQRIAGFFTATPNPNSDHFAELSTPLLVKRWYLYSMKAEVLNTPLWNAGLRLGVLDGGNPQQWLQVQNIPFDLTADSPKQLLEQLNKGRTDLILADQASIEQALLSNPQFNRPQARFFKLAPVGVYFSRRFLKSQPLFLEAFNRAAEQCRAPMPPLSQTARDKAMGLAKIHLQTWIKQPEVRQWLNQKNKLAPPSDEEIQHKDALWKSHANDAARQLISSTLLNDLALNMQASVRRYADIYNELMLTDRYGRLLAASGMTHDYYQGDEGKFTAALNLKHNEVFIGELEYDQSTQAFAIPTAMALRDADQQLMGVLILMLDANAVGD